MGTTAKLRTDYKDLLPPLSSDEFEALKADIKANGVLVPIIVDENGTILDGHHRYSIDKDAPRKVVKGLTEPEKEAFVIRANLVRRNLSPDQRRELRDKQRDIAKRLRESDDKRWTQASVAKVLGLSRQAVDHWFNRDAINDATCSNANKPDARVTLSADAKSVVVERVKAGESQVQVAADFKVSQPTISNVVRAAERKAENKKKQDEIASVAVAGKFTSLYDVIVIDPPWPMEKIEREVRPNQSVFDYPTMTENELAAFTIPAASDCHVWVWTTHKFLPMAFRLLDSWDLKYVCTFVWHKPGGFQPIGLPQYNCEFALYARRGSPKFKTTKAFNTALQFPRGKHSEKPDGFYELLRRVTSGKRIDIFNRREIEGFDGWGNEALAG